MMVDIKPSPARRLSQIPNDIIQSHFDISVEWAQMEKAMADYLNDEHSSAINLHERDKFVTIGKRYKTASLAFQAFKASCKNALVDVRHGSSSPEHFRIILREIQASDNSPQAISSMIAQASEKLDFRKRTLSNGGNYLDHTGAQKFISTGSNVYIFYFTEAMKQDKESWNTNQDIIFNLLKRNSGDYFVAAVECNSTELKFTKSRITFYRRCKVVVQDMAKTKDHADQSFARCEQKEFDKNKCSPPTDRRLVRIPCPHLPCGREARAWNCYQCRIPLQCHEGYIYCKCGRADAKRYSWQCNSEEHGKDFLGYNALVLEARLRKLCSSRDLNILILGETGVGKSTWINAFYNYLMFTTFDEAMAHSSLEYVVPSSFSMQHVDRSTSPPRFVQKNVRVGEFNSMEAEGMRSNSETQKAGVYRIPIGDAVVRLIDTPGFGDTKANEERLSNILDALNRVRSLHGIIILLKPDASRLNLMFKYCVQELLPWLHPDVARNIVWGFTNTRQLNYMPGDSLQLLQGLLQEHKSPQLTLSPDDTPVSDNTISYNKVFCFDSESFRYLAAKKQAEITMPNQDVFQQSWESSMNETYRLLEYFSKLEPRLVNNMADIIERTIELNMSEMSDNALITKLPHLMKYLSRIDIEVTRLDMPRTVCMNLACVEMKDIAGVKRPTFKDGCFAKGAQRFVRHLGAKGNKRSKFRDASLCGNSACGHQRSEHKHIYFTETEKVTQTGFKGAQPGIIPRRSKEQAYIAVSEKELEQIRNTAAHFSIFLKKNSIADSDTMVCYLDELIAEERATIAFLKSKYVAIRNNEKRLSNLKNSRKMHKERIKMLEERMMDSKDVEPLNEKGVEDLVNKLYNLPTWGKTLRNIQSAIEWSQAAEFPEQVLQPATNEDVLKNMKWINARPASAVSTTPPVTIKFVSRPEADSSGVKRPSTDSDSDNEYPRKSRRFSRFYSSPSRSPAPDRSNRRVLRSGRIF
ncbi:hypothetical protein F5Y13DRAFT_182532 [Hypoxylon sp. FL1857]|nr:hypothetical protein F5Y13DRAFT_182532 [Hypoxylon sp. FL1857]